MKKFIIMISLILLTLFLLSRSALAHSRFGIFIVPPLIFLPPPPGVVISPGYYPPPPPPDYYENVPQRVWVPGHWGQRWTPYGWDRVWIPGYWEYIP